MAANGTNYRFHTYNPDILQAAVIGPIEESEYSAWLLPVKKAQRDCKLSQLTCFVEGMMEPPEPETGELTATICLYRLDEDILTAPAVMRNVATKVANSEVSVVGQFISQRQWVFSTELMLEGGTYWWALVLDTNITAEFAFVTWVVYLVNDGDANVQFPKYDLTLAATPALPTQINIQNIAYNTSEWIYTSGEWQ